MSVRKSVLWGVGLVLCAGLALADEVRVKVAKANLRATASTSAAIVGKVEQGKTLELIETSGQWMKVKNGGATGWIHSSLVEKITASSAAPPTAAPAAPAAAEKPKKERKAGSADKPLSLGVGASLANHKIGFGIDGRVVAAPMKSLPNLRVIAAMDYYVKSESGWQVTGNAAYVIPIHSKDLRPYVGAGIVLSHANGASSTDPDLAGGVEYKKRVFAEGRVILADESVFVVSAGLKF
jgi:hypothetical protein